jgi:hypothetical protein
LTGLRYRIAGPNGMNVEHVVGLYANLGHGDFCKMMLKVHGILVVDDMNLFLEKIAKVCRHNVCKNLSKINRVCIQHGAKRFAAATMDATIRAKATKSVFSMVRRGFAAATKDATIGS